jgi:hypothetical protein
MTMQDFYGLAVLFSLAAPFTIFVYLVALLLIRPSLKVFLASLLGGLIMGLINIGADLAAYYAHWWHYTLKELIFHLPLPFYMTTMLIYGSMIYLLIWRFWRGRWHWLARLLLFGLPIFGIVRDIVNERIGASYILWDSFWAVPVTIVMWPLMFYAGYLLFSRMAPSRHEAAAEQQGDEVARVQKITQ